MERDILGDASVLKRLLAKTRPEGDCLLFASSIAAATGYAYLWDGERPTGAHRVSYRVHHGPIPDGLEVCHTCDVRNCVNPDHLFVGTRTDNMHDMDAKLRRSQGPEHGALISAGWTPAHRAKKAEQTRTRLAAERARKRAEAGVPDDWFQCQDCQVWAPADNFPLRPNGTPHSYCLACNRERVRQRQAAHRARKRPKQH